MSGLGKDVSGMVRISQDEVRAGTFPDNVPSGQHDLPLSFPLLHCSDMSARTVVVFGRRIRDNELLTSLSLVVAGHDESSVDDHSTQNPFLIYCSTNCHFM